MNKYLTFCAQAKLLRLIEKMDASAVRLVSLPKGTLSIEFVFTPPALHDIIVSITPRVITDLATMKLLNDGSVDFSYETDDFIITRDKDVIPAYA